MNIWLIAVVALLAIFGIIGYVKGLIKIVVSIATLIITIFVAGVLSPVVINLLKQTPVYDGLEKMVYTTIMNQDLEETDFNVDFDFTQISDVTEESGVDLNLYKEEIAGYLGDVSKNLNLPDIISDSMSEFTLDGAKENALESIKDITKYSDGSVKSIGVSILASRLTEIIFKAIVYVVLFIIVFIVLKIASLALDIISKLPVVKQANQVGGLMVGLVEGLFAVWLMFLVITALGSMSWASEALVEIGSNPVLTFLYDINPIIRILL